VQTHFHELDGNDGFFFGGLVLADGGAPVLEAGIHISKQISFDEFIQLSADAPTPSNAFHIPFSDLEPGTLYYYRAYAVNQAGESFGSLRKLKTRELPDPTKWWTETIQLGGDWRLSEWLGEFRAFGNGWIYQLQLGWAYTAPDEREGLWMWTERNGWLWSQSGVWPYLWSHNSGNWLYLLGGSNGDPIFYHFGIGAYFSVPPP